MFEDIFNLCYYFCTIKSINTNKFSTFMSSLQNYLLLNEKPLERTIGQTYDFRQQLSRLHNDERGEVGVTVALICVGLALSNSGRNSKDNGLTYAGIGFCLAGVVSALANVFY